ncbi:MAG: GNAT family N-acetyltransferase [Chlamydiales bacterium]
MFKYFIAPFLLLCGIFYGEPHNFEKNRIAYLWQSAPNYIDSKRVFVEAFVKCYSKIPLDVLGESSREEIVEQLNLGFEKIYVECTESKNFLWLSAEIENRVVGFIVIELTKYPEEIYLAVLAIDPAYQRRGIASSMVHSLVEQFADCGRFVVITRKANEEAMHLYRFLGFVPSSYMHEGYNRELYTGFCYSRADSIE